MMCYSEPRWNIFSLFSLFSLFILIVSTTAPCYRAFAQRPDGPLSMVSDQTGDPSVARLAAIEIKPLLIDPLTANDSALTLGAATTNKSIGSPEMVAWLRKLICEHVPPTYEDNRKWNLQREVWDGVHIKLDGLKLDTHRKHKLVNAGTWTRYAVNIVDAEKNLNIEFQRLEQIDSGKIAFATTVVAPLNIHGQLAEYARNVKLYSISAHATSTVKLRLTGTVQFQLNMLKLPPDIAIRPVVEQADLQILHFEVHRISRIGGEAAELLGKGMRRVINDKVAELNQELVGKINGKLDKKADRLSFSTQDWLMSKFPLPSGKVDSSAASVLSQ